jgi:hypothetical protein
MTNRTTLEQLVVMPKAQIEDLPIDHLSLLLEDVATLKAQAKRADDVLTIELDRRFGEQAQAARKAKGKDTGTVTLAIDDANIKADLPPKYQWDQEKLAKAVAEIKTWDGENVAEYVTTEYKVSEAKYKAWPTTIKKVFEPARTVSVGKPSYSIELLERAKSLGNGSIEFTNGPRKGSVVAIGRAA